MTTCTTAEGSRMTDAVGHKLPQPNPSTEGWATWVRLGTMPSPRPSGHRDRDWGGGGGSEAEQVCVPKIDLQFRAPLMNFILLLKKSFLMWVGGWVGGWVGQAQEPRLTFPPTAR